MLMNRDNNGFILAMDMSRNFNHKVFSGILELRFQLKVENPYFVNFTNIPFKVDQYFEFKPPTEEKMGFLHSGKYVSESCIQESSEDGLKGHIILKLNFNDEWFGRQMKTEISPFEYVVNFEKRACYWEYIIKLKKGKTESIDNFSIVPKNTFSEKIVFNSAVNSTREGGEGVIKIKSKNPIPLEEKPRVLFELQRSGQPGVQVPYTRILPNGSPRNLKFCTLNNQYITEIFVKL